MIVFHSTVFPCISEPQNFQISWTKTFTDDEFEKRLRSQILASEKFREEKRNYYVTVLFYFFVFVIHLITQLRYCYFYNQTRPSVGDEVFL